MTIEQIPIAQLQFASYNPRTLSQKEFEELQRSLDEFGCVEPIVVNRQGSRIVSGHQRVRAAQALGWADAPVVWVDLDEAHEKALNIAMNAIGGEFDTDQLAELIATLDEEMRDLTGFDPDEISKLQDGWADVEAAERVEKSETTKEPSFTISELRTKAEGCSDEIKAFVESLNG